VLNEIVEMLNNSFVVSRVILCSRALGTRLGIVGDKTIAQWIKQGKIIKFLKHEVLTVLDQYHWTAPANH
jgi:hypothetical protein